MSNLVKYSGNHYERINYSEHNHRGPIRNGRNKLNNQLKLAEIEAGHMLRDEMHNTAKGKSKPDYLK